MRNSDDEDDLWLDLEQALIEAEVDEAKTQLAADVARHQLLAKADELHQHAADMHGEASAMTQRATRISLLVELASDAQVIGFRDALIEEGVMQEPEVLILSPGGDA
jgi:uncharacterized coiled-coil DUF342 family protein